VGTVLVKGERWRASSASGFPLPAGTRVKVVGVQGFQLIVEQIDNNE
jgi:membrane protein implicated in regulation of membrane protease activity